MTFKLKPDLDVVLTRKKVEQNVFLRNTLVSFVISLVVFTCAEMLKVFDQSGKLISCCLAARRPWVIFSKTRGVVFVQAAYSCRSVIEQTNSEAKCEEQAKLRPSWFAKASQALCAKSTSLSLTLSHCNSNPGHILLPGRHTRLHQPCCQA